MSAFYVPGSVGAKPGYALMQLTIERDNKQANRLWPWRTQCFPLNFTASCLSGLKQSLRAWPFITTSVDSLVETASGNTRVSHGDYVFLLSRDLQLSVWRKQESWEIRSGHFFFFSKRPSNHLTILSIFYNVTKGIFYLWTPIHGSYPSALDWQNTYSWIFISLLTFNSFKYIFKF